MSNLKLFDFAHKLLSGFYFILVKIIRPNARYVGSEVLKREFKKSDTIYALATGQSICDYTEEDFKKIGSADSIGLNFFIFHKFLPSFYLIETHSPKLGYFEILRNKKLFHSPVLYKGYGSPGKFFNVIANMLRVPGIVENLFIVKDAYIKGDWPLLSTELRQKVLDGSKSDFLYNYIASILYIVFMAYKMGYKSVVLCGFDMTNKYFYCENKELFHLANNYDLCCAKHMNKIHADKNKKETIIKLLCEMNERFKEERDGGVYVHSHNMSLSKYLPIYTES